MHIQRLHAFAEVMMKTTFERWKSVDLDQQAFADLQASHDVWPRKTV